MKQKREPKSLSQARPAALVFEVADHLQQFVGVVVYPARAAEATGNRSRWFPAGLCGFKGRPRNPPGTVGSEAEESAAGLSAIDELGDALAELGRLAVPWARSLRLAVGWWAFDAEEPVEAQVQAHAHLGLPV